MTWTNEPRANLSDQRARRKLDRRLYPYWMLLSYGRHVGYPKKCLSRSEVVEFGSQGPCNCTTASPATRYSNSSPAPSTLTINVLRRIGAMSRGLISLRGTNLRGPRNRVQ